MPDDAYTPEIDAKLESMKRVLGKVGGKARSSGMDDLVDLWMKVRQPKERRARERTVRYVSRFIEVVGGVEPTAITQDHAVRFRNAMADAGKGEAYQRKHLDHMSALMGAARSEGIVSANPFAGVNARRMPGKFVDKVKRKPFTGAQVKLVLNMAEKGLGPEHLRPDIVWALRLSAYHGSRIGEICQLQKDDVRIEQGIPVLVIHDEDERTVKNFQSVRTVPLHKACAGFLEYAAKAKGPQVFGFTFYQEGAYAGWLIRNFPRFRREVCKITDPKITLHSLRHTWIDASRNTAMPENVRRSIIGQRKEAGVLGQYGEGATLSVRAKWLNKVNPLKG